ncbi:unnamed protein product [marine sediment metagenome]|uniref:Uncharacterized protein n=1 Tax=marine sediment metagenome TaxID=412755 RepID=X1S722_9ZZZZ
MMWLKLTRTIYLKLEVHGILKLMLNIYSGWDLSLVRDKKILLGNYRATRSHLERSR